MRGREALMLGLGMTAVVALIIISVPMLLQFLFSLGPTGFLFVAIALIFYLKK